VPDLFAGRASSAFFRFGGGRVTVTGRFADGSRFSETIEPREAPLAAIDHLWARARIVDLEDEFRAAHSEKAKKEIVALSIKHTVLTRLTAFVVIDLEVVNKGGGRRTVVQPVELPAEWEPQHLTMAAGPMIPMGTAMRGAPAAPPPTRAMASAPMKKMRFMGPPARRPPAPEVATPAELENVRKALEAFVEAFKSRKLQDLEATRMELMKALADALVIATAVPLLQAFLRSAAVEIIAALKAGAAAPFDRHAAALQAALDEARAPLGATSAKAGSFWEASI
jgi:hypothetical protein